MKRNNIILLTAALLLTVLFSSCKKEPEFIGRLWQWDTTISEFGETDVPFSVRAIFSSKNTGMLFFVMEIEDEVWGTAIAMPFTYTDNGDKGLLNIDPKSYYGATSIAWSYNQKAQEMTIQLGDLAKEFGLTNATIALSEGQMYTYSDLTGTVWTADMTEVEGESDIFTLSFNDASTALLTDTYTYEGETDKETYKLNYTYKGGLGDFTYSIFGSTERGGFYLIDQNNMFLSDGMNLLNMKKAADK